MSGRSCFRARRRTMNSLNRLAGSTSPAPAILPFRRSTGAVGPPRFVPNSRLACSQWLRSASFGSDVRCLHLLRRLEPLSPVGIRCSILLREYYLGGSSPRTSLSGGHGHVEVSATQ